MNLAFKTKFEGGQPTHFIAKIWNGLIETVNYEEYLDWQYNTDVKLYDLDSLFLVETAKPKLHTIREDKANRWTAGTLIHFIINNRTPNRIQFAPVIPVISTQDIEIIRTSDYLNKTIVKVDGRKLSEKEVQQLAWNDGFENTVAFWLWFQDGFTGKIIHWTNLKY